MNVQQDVYVTVVCAGRMKKEAGELVRWMMYMGIGRLVGSCVAGSALTGNHAKIPWKPGSFPFGICGSSNRAPLHSSPPVVP